ncbi:hypothetical protein GCM10023215_34010 [Pseudonocardia yuanmonensis]|uniref:Uncharacterized protein n=1 Tax=Pseudonocardia yuanmonensis TaxID=1095914 RepID=A0ABP8WUD5_9PSEU
MEVTREVGALEALPETVATTLCGDFVNDIVIQVNINACYYTCGVTQINEA